MSLLETYFRMQFDSDSEDSDSNSDSENKQDGRVDLMEEKLMIYRSFLTRLNGIFTESKEDDDYAGEENDNKPTNYNSNPTSQKTKGKKRVRVSKRENKSLQITNPAIKYQNNKEKRKK